MNPSEEIVMIQIGLKNPQQIIQVISEISVASKIIDEIESYVRANWFIKLIMDGWVFIKKNEERMKFSFLKRNVTSYMITRQQKEDPSIARFQANAIRIQEKIMEMIDRESKEREDGDRWKHGDSGGIR